MVDRVTIDAIRAWWLDEISAEPMTVERLRDLVGPSSPSTDNDLASLVETYEISAPRP